MKKCQRVESQSFPHELNKKTGPSLTPFIKSLIKYYFLLRPARPIKPRPRSSMVVGSGTALAVVPTVNPYQFSYVLVQESDVNVPVNWTTPFPSFPDTVLLETEIDAPPYCEFGPPASKVGVKLKVNDAATEGLPRLQIAKTGSVIGEANVIVPPPGLPFIPIMSPTVLGEVVTVPPIKEPFGLQLPAVPSIVVFMT